MGLTDLRGKRRETERRADELSKAISLKQSKRRDLLERMRTKGERNPQNEVRAQQLDREIRHLQKDAHRLRKRIEEMRDRHGVLAHKLKVLAKRIAKAIKRRKAKRNSGAAQAVKWALAQNGIHESPPGSNWGEPVSTWIRNAGYGGPVPWCGCFAHEAVVVHGGANVLMIQHTQAAGSTSAQTFKVRGGMSSAGTCTFNGAGGARVLGAITKSSIVVEEWT